MTSLFAPRKNCGRSKRAVKALVWAGGLAMMMCSIVSAYVIMRRGTLANDLNMNVMMLDEAGVMRCLHKGADPNVRVPKTLKRGIPGRLEIWLCGVGYSGDGIDALEMLVQVDNGPLAGVHGKTARIANALLNHGADVDTRDSSGVPVFSSACSFMDAPTIHTFIDRGADVNVRDRNGRTPLMYAALCLRADNIELLLKSGADSSMRNDAGQNVEGYFRSLVEAWQAQLPPSDEGRRRIASIDNMLLVAVKGSERSARSGLRSPR